MLLKVIDNILPGIGNLPKIGIIGLGYVGLPLAYYFSKKFPVVGFDINKKRIERLLNGNDDNNEINTDCLKKALSHQLHVTSNLNSLCDVDIYIVTVPTPVNENNQPELSPLIQASKDISKVISNGNFVIFESTVYPGATEEECIPVIEKHSNLVSNEDFFYGYSPERINPGDKINKLPNIKKVVSGSNTYALNLITELYESIIDAGVFKASSVKIAEASKIIENTQRDVNIALINEFSMLFDKLDIDTYEVLDAASTKWNFINLKPGLVGGHCIGVDPYYLIHKANSVGYVSDLIKTGRQINSNMPLIICQKIINGAVIKKINVAAAKCLVLGYTFKENCPDIRNSGAITLIKELSHYFEKIDVYDPVADENLPAISNNTEKVDNIVNSNYDVIVVCVSHNEFSNDFFKRIINNKLENNHFIFTLKPLPGLKIDKTL